MATDLSAVTETIKTLIDRILLENNETMVTSTAAPPDASLNENKVSVYLYHVLESPEFKNLPPTKGSGPVPIQHAPMGLILQYIITVIHGSSENISNESVIAEQKILGFVARAIHDFPVISETTRIPIPLQPDIVILHPDLIAQKNTLRLNLRPATREETIAFWSSSDDKLPRLSLYLEVRVAILDPRDPLTLPGIVLRVGNFIFPGGPPQLTSTSNVLRFRPPVTVTTEPQSVTASPARPTLLPLDGDPNDPTLGLLDPDPLLNLIGNSEISIEATDIRLGQRFLVLKRESFEVTMRMDSTDNPQWNFVVTSNLVRFNLRRRAFPRSLDAAPGSLPGAPKFLNPGVYTARVIIKTDGVGHKPQSTNEIAFTAIPQIAQINNSGGKVFALHVAGEFFGLGADPDNGAELISEDEIVLAVGGVVLRPIPTNDTTLPITDPAAEGRFKIFGGGAPTERIDFQLPEDFIWPATTEPIVLPVSLVVRGAPATPDWLVSLPP